MNSKSKYTKLIKTEAKRLGFLSCGISKAEFLEEEAPRLEKWLNNNMHGQMQYMENHFDKRLDPTLLVDGSKSVVSLLLNYFPSEEQNKDSLAEQNINEAITILEDLEDYYPISVYLTYLADIYVDKGNFDLALKYAQRSLDLATSYGLKEQISDANLKLSELYSFLLLA